MLDLLSVFSIPIYSLILLLSKIHMITGLAAFILKSFFCIKANTSLSRPTDIPVAGQSKFPKLLTRLSYLPPPPIDPN